jgi:hypothetical protein
VASHLEIGHPPDFLTVSLTNIYLFDQEFASGFDYDELVSGRTMVV